MGNTTFLMKRNATILPYLNNEVWNIGVFKNESYTIGFAGYKLREKVKNSLAIGSEYYGSGDIIYFSDSPIIRGF